MKFGRIIIVLYTAPALGASLAQREGGTTAVVDALHLIPASRGPPLSPSKVSEEFAQTGAVVKH